MHGLADFHCALSERANEANEQGPNGQLSFGVGSRTVYRLLQGKVYNFILFC